MVCFQQADEEFALERIVAAVLLDVFQYLDTFLTEARLQQRVVLIYFFGQFQHVDGSQLQLLHAVGCVGIAGRQLIGTGVEQVAGVCPQYLSRQVVSCAAGLPQSWRQSAVSCVSGSLV